MWKIDFYLLPSSDYQEIGIDEVQKLDDNLKYLQENEKIYIPSEFYDKEDKNHITISDYIFGMEQNEVTDYLLEIISKQRQCEVTYESLEERTEIGYLAITHEDVLSELADICVECTRDVEEEKSIRVNDVIKVKRYYLKKVDSFDKYKDKADVCFPHIVFHKDAFKYVQRLGKCADVIDELTRHLVTLNDVAKKLYEYNGRNEKQTLNELKSTYNIECSGKGSNEEESFNKEIVFGTKKYQLTCNPHTKLFKKHTDQRIYFCWGRSEIREHSIIIVRIGDHWKE